MSGINFFLAYVGARQDWGRVDLELLQYRVHKTNFILYLF